MKYPRSQAEANMAAEIETLVKGLSMASTGNREQDEAYLHEAALTTAMIAAGKCPNGCGEMTKGERGQSCGDCGFATNVK